MASCLRHCGQTRHIRQKTLNTYFHKLSVNLLDSLASLLLLSGKQIFKLRVAGIDTEANDMKFTVLPGTRYLDPLYDGQLLTAVEFFMHIRAVMIRNGKMSNAILQRSLYEKIRRVFAV